MGGGGDGVGNGGRDGGSAGGGGDAGEGEGGDAGSGAGGVVGGGGNVGGEGTLGGNEGGYRYTRGVKDAVRASTLAVPTAAHPNITRRKAARRITRESLCAAP